MSEIKKTEILECAEELLKKSRKVSNRLAHARLRAFYLYKSGKAKQYEAIAREVGYERHAVGQWFKC